MKGAMGSKLVRQIRSCTFSIRACGQCPPNERISFLGFDFRNKMVVQDVSQGDLTTISRPKTFPEVLPVLHFPLGMPRAEISF